MPLARPRQTPSMVAPDSRNRLNKYFHEFSRLCHVLQPAEWECLVETASSRAALTWTARGFASACRIPTAAPAPAAGSGAAAKRVSIANPLTEFLPPLFCWLSQLFSPSPACHNDMYGPDCKFSCSCQNGGVCNRFSGCQCPSGWRGRNCQKPGTTGAKIAALKRRKTVSPLNLLSCNALSQTGLRRSWIWRVIWREIWTQAPRFIVPPQATHCPATTALSCESQTARFSR